VSLVEYHFFFAVAPKTCTSLVGEGEDERRDKSEEDGKINVWKTAMTVPIHKRGNLAQIENYRPVALLFSFSKVFEIAILNSLSSVWRSILTPSQHGFLKGRSIVTNERTWSV
jgi:hypothetical protein